MTDAYRRRAAAAERAREYRRRRDQGLITLRAVVVELDVVERLISEGLLRPEHAEDRREIQRAFNRALVRVMRDDTT